MRTHGWLLVLAMVGGCDAPEDRGDDASRAGGDITVPDDEPTATICPAIYGPVCGDDGVTYTNSCWMQAADADMLWPGICTDFDGSWCVDFTDFLILAANYGLEADHEEGDADGDGEVTFIDFLMLANEFETFGCG